MTDSALDSFVDFAAGLSFAEIPESVLTRTADIFTDTLACATGARSCLAATISGKLRSVPVSPQERGRVIGLPAESTAELAAFWNTSMIRHLDYNDASPPPTSGHPSDMIGAILAMCGTANPDGKQVLLSIVVAYEIFARLAASVQRKPRTIEMGYAATVAATAACCCLLNLSADQMRHAISMAASSGVSLRSTRAGQLSNYKGVATAVSMRNAVLFALLARDGMTGPEAPFEGRHGIVELLERQPGPLQMEPFGQWNTLKVRLKYWPVAYNMQPSIEAGIQLREKVPVDDVSRVVIHADTFSWNISGNEPEKWDPQTRETADHSLPFVFARALAYGTVDNSSFAPEALRDSATRGLMSRVHVVEDEAAQPDTVRVELTTNANVIHDVSVSGCRGHQSNPFTREDLAKKFHYLVEPVLGDRTTKAFEAALTVGESSVEAVLQTFDVPAP